MIRLLIPLIIIVAYFLSGQNHSVANRTQNIKNTVFVIKLATRSGKETEGKKKKTISDNYLSDIRKFKEVFDAEMIIRNIPRLNIKMKLLDGDKFIFIEKAIMTEEGFIIDSDKLTAGSKLKLKVEGEIYDFEVLNAFARNN